MAFPDTYIAPEEYLRRERSAFEKSEYFNGQIYAMAGASPDHVQISGNCYALLWNQLRGKPCRVNNSDLRVQISETGAYTYPDVSVACDPEYGSELRDNLLNPVVLIEVLSRSTELQDRGAKWQHYQRIPSLRHYLLVRQDRPQIEHYWREGEEWKSSVLTGVDGSVRLDAIDCELRLSDVYDRVDLPTPASE